MIDANTATQHELDQGAQLTDARAGARVVRAVYDFLGRFISYPNDHARVAHALWVVHCHLMDRWDTTPRLAFLSAEPASGKSRALEITELLVPLPVATINATPAYVFRKIGAEEGRPTILFDEIDAIFGNRATEHEDLRALLNAGHRRGATVGRCIAVGKGVITEDLPAFSAVALAGLGWLPDTILTRSIIIRMRPRKSDEKVEPYRSRIHAAPGGAIKDAIEVWATSLPPDFEYPELPDGIADRAADVWEPVLTVAALVGGEWPSRGRAAALALLKAGQDAEPSLGLRLLEDLRAVFGDRDYIATAVILGRLLEIEESQWADPWGRNPAKPLDGRGLAKLLKVYGIKPQLRRDGGAVLRGYARGDFEDAWARYLSPMPGKSVTSATALEAAHSSGWGVAPVTPVTQFPGHARRSTRYDDALSAED